MYSFWSGELQGIQEVVMEEFGRAPTFSSAHEALGVVLKTRADFLYFKSRDMVTGDLPPFDWRLVRNLFVGMRNSIRMKINF
jgi:hypothetical protein